MSNLDKIMSNFNKEKKVIEKYTLTMQDLISELLKSYDIKVHSVTSRVKDYDSLREKIASKEEKYSSLWDITDLSGIRIIAVYEDDVDQIGSIIESEFLIDERNSIDKRRLLDPDRFGYLSLHYIVSFSNQRWKLSEYKKFQGLKAEIQVRSLLQHAWAGIVHDLGYKSKLSIPKLVWRKFYRLSGLLELADQEFINLREQLREYNESLPHRIHNNPNEVGIDSASLRTYINSDDMVFEMDSIFIERFSQKGFGRSSIPAGDEILDILIIVFKSLNISSIQEIQILLREKESHILKFAESFLKENKKAFFRAGKTLEFLIYIILLEQCDKEGIIDFLTKHSLVRHKKVESFTDNIIQIFNEIQVT